MRLKYIMRNSKTESPYTNMFMPTTHKWSIGKSIVSDSIDPEQRPQIWRRIKFNRDQEKY